MSRAAPLVLALALAASQPVLAAKDGICILYANDATRSFYFSGVSPAGKLVPQLLSLPSWDALLVGLDAGEDDDTFFIIPEGVGADPNMTIATLRTNASSHTASVTYATLSGVPGFDAPYTYMNTVHLDKSRSQMIATLVGMSGPPPSSRGVGDPGDLFYVVADVFPANGTVSRVWLDLSEQDMRWGGGAVSGVSAFDGAVYWVNPIGGQVPSGQALYGFPLNGSAPVAVPYGSSLNIAHLFYSEAQGGLIVVLESTGSPSVPSLARFNPPSTTFETIFTWPGGPSDWGTYDVSYDGSLLLATLVDRNGENPSVSVVDLVSLKEVSRIKLQGFGDGDTVCDVNFCNY